MDQMSQHYNENYFSWQREVGRFGGRANLFKFSKHIKKTDRVLDYGCGGGYLLEQLDCALKVGIDINPVIGSPNGVTILRDYKAVVAKYSENFFDVIISNHALEHIENPVSALKECYQLLKPGGRIIVVVPHDSHKIRYSPNDVHQHIFTFSPMNLGNLMSLSGFQEIQVRRLFHRWPPAYARLAKVNFQLFHTLSYFYGLIKQKSVQLIAIAEKPE
jgi:2-polyprenyl-3-methyl-5-hydroxy-6-metoxy-1,4-benzoquinol methylase